MSDPDAPDDAKVHQCIDCKAWSPMANTNYTLISARHGWRLSREVDAKGNKVLEWRCPTCWSKRKQTSPDSSRSSKGGPAR